MRGVSADYPLHGTHAQQQHTVFSYDELLTFRRIRRYGLAVAAHASTSTPAGLKVKHQRYCTFRLALCGTGGQVLSGPSPHKAFPIATKAALRAVGGNMPADTTCMHTIGVARMAWTWAHKREC